MICAKLQTFTCSIVLLAAYVYECNSINATETTRPEIDERNNDAISTTPATFNVSRRTRRRDRKRLDCEYMKAILLKKFGKPIHLQVEEIPKPEPGYNQVLVRVKSASINPIDVYTRLGNITERPPLPIILGKEAAGVVVKVNNVTEFQFVSQKTVARSRLYVSLKKAVAYSGKRLLFEVGDKVICCFVTYGAYAEYVVCNSTHVLKFPDTLTFNEASTIYMSYFTAYRALIQKARLKAGETVYIHGGTGGFGIAALQIAKHKNCTVTSTFGTKDGAEMLVKLGANEVQNHRRFGHTAIYLILKRQNGYDVVLETRAHSNLGPAVFALNRNGRLIIINSIGHAHFNPHTFIIEEAEMQGVSISDIKLDEFQEISAAIFQGVRDGWVKPVIDRIYNMTDIVQAHSDFQTKNQTLGKYVLEFEK